MVLKRKLDHAKRKRIGGVQYSGDQSIVLGWLNTVDRRVYDIKTISQETLQPDARSRAPGVP